MFFISRNDMRVMYDESTVQFSVDIVYKTFYILKGL